MARGRAEDMEEPRAVVERPSVFICHLFLFDLILHMTNFFFFWDAVVEHRVELRPRGWGCVPKWDAVNV